MIRDLEARITKLEALLGVTPRAAGGSDQRVNKRRLAQIEDVSPRTIDRNVKRGLLPPPIIENGRCYWLMSQVREHKQQLAAQREAA